MTSLLVLSFFVYFIITAENYEIEWNLTSVSDDFLVLGWYDNEWYITLDNIILDDTFDWWSFTYIVKAGDNLSKIAYEFWATTTNLKKINNLKSNIIRPWQRLVISEEEWIVYDVKKNSTIKDFAKTYNLELNNLMNLNYIQNENEQLYKWDEIFIPVNYNKAIELWLIEKPKPLPKPKPVVKKNSSNSKPTTNSTPQVNSSYNWKSIIAKWYYNPNISNGFYRWHCTWYVAMKKFPYINSTKQSKLWWWNANKWYENAKNAWYSVWQTPRVWSIVVLKYWWTNYYYAGHVGIILKVEKDRLLIEEMNAVWKFIVTRRWIKRDSKIKWYIYL